MCRSCQAKYENMNNSDARFWSWCVMGCPHRCLSHDKASLSFVSHDKIVLNLPEFV